ncbi:hypothetical protein FQZ97_489580 [compost metagenome]
MMYAARWRPATLYRCLQCCNRQTRVDTPTDGVTDDQPGPGIEDDRDVDEAGWQRDVSDVGNPKLVGAGRHDVLRQVREDQAIMIAVGGGDEPAANFRMQIVLTHCERDEQPTFSLLIETAR